jgi:hypothetical protein
VATGVTPTGRLSARHWRTPGSARQPGQCRVPGNAAAYGDEQAMEQIQAGAAMAQQGGPQMPSGSPQAGAGAPNPLDSVVGLGEPSAQPGTPVTDGAAAGPGQGPEALGIPDPNKADAAAVAKYLPVWIQIADDPQHPARVQGLRQERQSRISKGPTA